MIGRRSLLAAAVFAGALLTSLPARPWSAHGHRVISEAAVAALPAEMPDFLRHGGKTVAQASLNPDLVRLRDTPQLRSAVGPEHYLDAELLPPHLTGSLPRRRYDYLGELVRSGGNPAFVGLLPYAIEENVQRLAVAFAEYRRWSGTWAVQMKALEIAGAVSHYAGDLEQPLHTTVHHNGRALPDGTSPRTGIHRLVDSLPGRIALDAGDTQRSSGDEVPSLGELFSYIEREFGRSHRLVDRVYELEPLLSWEEPETPDPEVVAFTRERILRAAGFVAALIESAWRESERIELPDWYDRQDAPASDR